jgi:ribosomal-protein-alanine N-acetyltransferase
MERHAFDWVAFFKSFPILNVGTLNLRELRIFDDADYYEILSHDRVAEFISDEDLPSSIYNAREEIKFWAKLFNLKRSVFWAIADQKTDKLMGTIGFNYWNFHNNRAEISYELGFQYWRKGIMSQVLKKVLDFAFSQMHLQRIEAKTMTNNIASAAVLRKMNFQKEGTLRAYRKVRGNLIDVDLYSLIPEDFAKLKAEF